MSVRPPSWNWRTWQPPAIRQWTRRLRAQRIRTLSARLKRETASGLRQRFTDLRWDVRTHGMNSRTLAQALALGCVALERMLGFPLHDVQLLGGLVLLEGGIAEMQTGEGKTVTAILPALAWALHGRGCHIITANDYLAARDAAGNRDVFAALGLSTGCITSSTPRDQRREAYAADVTYATAREIGFDYLRDRLAFTETRQQLQRPLWGAIVDEADSIYIDEARTPFVISAPADHDPAFVELACWCQQSASALAAPVEYEVDPVQRSAWLTPAGCRTVLSQKKPALLNQLDCERIYRQVEWSLIARENFRRDKHYLVEGSRLGILDESTGRILPGRQWQTGLQQALEAREGLPISPVTSTAAEITVQRLFRQYRHLAGMTGTAWNVAAELRRNFNLTTVRIPPFRPCRREIYAPRIFSTRNAKWLAVAASVEMILKRDRAVLIGTPSVDSSEEVSRILRQQGIAHRVLNARFDRQEAEIIAQAGQRRQVTVATNMAGRGTDIQLASEVALAGGLHVIATEMHSSSRIDRQLEGRCARQGDPGSFQLLVSLEDELLHLLPEEERERHQAAAANAELSADWLHVFEEAQQRLEQQHALERSRLLMIETERVAQCRELGLEPCLQNYD